MYTKRIGIQTSIPTAGSYSKHTGKTQRSNPSYGLKYFFGLPKNRTDLCARLVRTFVISFATLATTPFYIGLNELLGLTSQSTTQETSNSDSPRAIPPTVNKLDSNVKIDNFVKNYSGFETILDALLKSDIQDLKSLDIDKSGIVFDSNEDLESAIVLLEEDKQAVQLLTELKDLNELVWGNGNLDNLLMISQVNDGDCTVVGDVIGALLTKENIQKLKANLRVVRYEPGDKERSRQSVNHHILYSPKVDLEVTINGKTMTVCNGISREHTILDGARGPAAFIYALKIQNPLSFLPSLSLTTNLLTGEKYYTVPLITMSDDDLVQILTSSPPNSIIKLSTYPTANDYLNYFTEESTSPDDYKASENGLCTKHTYVVTGHEYENGELKIIVRDGVYGNHNRLSLNQIREDIAFISAPASTVHLLSSWTLMVWLLAIGTIGTTIVIPKQLEKKN